MSSAIVASSTRPLSNEEVTVTLSSSDFWLDMSDSSKFTLSSTTRINTITDKSANPKTITRVGTIAYDTVRKGIQPRGTTGVDYLTIGLSGPPSTASDAYETIFVVGYIYSGSGGAMLGGTATGHRILRIANNGVFYGAIGSTLLSASITIPTNQLYVSSVVLSNGTATIYHNARPIISGNSGSFSTSETTQTILRGNGTAFPMRGCIYEVIMFKRALTPTQIQSINNFLINKWRVNTSNSIASPLSLPGVTCALWLDGNDPSTITYGSGTKVQQWSDKSGNNRHAIQNNASFQPTYDSTLKGLKFIGLSGSSSTGLITTCPYSRTETVFAVVNLSTIAGNIVGTTSSARGRQIRPTTTSCLIISDATTLITLKYNALNTTSKYIFDYINDAGTNSYFEIDVNTVQDSEGGVLSYTAGTFNNVIGAATNSTVAAFDSYIYEIIIFNSALSTANRLEIEKYLTNKWNILNTPVTTDYSYPFYNSRPFLKRFSPLDFPGCILWLDAADSSTITFASGSTTNIATWTDKSLNRYVADAGVSNYPQYITNGLNRLPYVELRNIFDRFTMTSYNFTDNFLAIFVVVRMASSQPSSNSLVGIVSAENSPGSQTGRSIYADRNNLQYGVGYVSGGLQTRGTFGAYTPESWDIVYVSFLSVTSAILSIDGTASVTTIASTGGNNTNGLKIGSRDSNSSYTNNNAQCDIAEIIIYNTPFGLEQCKTIESYLAQKWGLVNNMAAGHPSRLYSALSVEFNAGQIGGCSLWLDAADPTTMTFSGSNVTTWRDKVAGFALTGSTPYTTISKRPAVQFTGGTTLSGSNFPFAFVCTTNTNFTTFLVQTTRSTTGVNSVPFGLQNSTTSTTRMFMFVSSSGGFFVDAGSAGSPRLNSATNFTVDIPQILVVRRAGTNVIYRKNGAQDSILTTGGNSFTSNTYIASISDSSGLWTGEMYEVIHVKNNLTDSEVRRVEGYLAHKWGLIDLLPSTHEFKKIKP